MADVHVVLRQDLHGGRNARDATYARACDKCREVQELALAQGVGRTGRLSRFFAPRVKCLTCLQFCSTRPPRTSRLLSCHRSVDGWHPDVPARPFAKLRSDKKQAKYPGSSFGADSLQR
jgi:hypothetical protein